MIQGEFGAYQKNWGNIPAGSRKGGGRYLPLPNRIYTVLTRKKHIKSFACKQKKRISHKVCRTEIFLGVEPEYHRANIKCVFSSELKMRRNREENKAVPINLF